MKQTRIILTVIAILVAVAALAIGYTRNRDPFAAAAVTETPFTPIAYSIQVFHWWDEGQVGIQLDWVDRVLNFGYVKQTFAWRNMEPRQGEWDFSQSDRIMDEIERREIRMIARLGQVPEWAAAAGSVFDGGEGHDAPPASLDDWATYCRTIAERYQGRIAAYQIWNEPNLAREWGNQQPNAAAYVEVLAACSEAIRAVDDDVIIISAGLSPTGNDDAIARRDDLYLDDMYQANFQQYVDVVGVHAPGWMESPAFGPDDAASSGFGRWNSFRRVEDLRKIMVANGDAARQMAILEFGWTTDTVNDEYSWFAVTEAEQAGYIVEAYEYAYENWHPWVGLMSLIYLPKPIWTEADEEWWWSIATPDGGLRPAFNAIAQMSRFCGDEIVPGWKPEWSEEEYDERRVTCY